MILLLGGTSETARLCRGLVDLGFSVLLSTATDAELRIGNSPHIRRRTGRLDQEGLTILARQQGVRALVDASHPYAVELQANAAAAARALSLPYLRYERPCLLGAESEVIWAVDHPQAADMACSYRLPILLTIGSRHLAPYAEAARRGAIPMLARVLPHDESSAACARAGLSRAERILGRGPFSEAENRELLLRYAIGVLVTKESGLAGGVAQKLAAARACNCQVIVVMRQGDRNGFAGIEELLQALPQMMSAAEQRVPRR